MSKVNVNGDDAHPVYKFLKESKPGIMGIQMIKWNFEKVRKRANHSQLVSDQQERRGRREIC